MPDRRAVSIGAALAVAAIAWLVVGSPPLNYDTAYALLWGRDLADAMAPDYEALGAPTPHPALTVLATPASLLGDRADTALRAAGYLSFGALVVVLFWLGAAIQSKSAGALAATLVATSPSVVHLGATAAKDVLFCTLVLAALVLELRDPRRGVPALVLLTVAGLLRPEAWLLTLAYWLYLARSAEPRRRVATAALAVTAPVVWTLSDLAATGEPFFSLTRTRALTVDLARETGVGSVPSALWDGLADLITWPAVLAGGVGLVAGLRVVPSRMAPVALLFGLAVAAFVVVGLAGLPLGARYLLLPAMPLAAAAGFLAFQWRRANARQARTAFAVGTGVLVVLLAATIPGRASDLRQTVDRLDQEEEFVAALRSLDDDPAAGRALGACARIGFRPGVYDALVPYLAYDLGRGANDFVPLGADALAAGAFVDPGATGRPPPAGYRLVAARGGWRVYARGCGQRTRRAASAVMSVQPRSR